MPVRDDLISTARARRAQGARLREIAADLDVSISTVATWVDPQLAQRTRERSRQAKLARRVPCDRCGRPLGYERSGGLCRLCILADAHARVERVVGLHADGVDPPAIAASVGLSHDYVLRLLARRLRADGAGLRYATARPSPHAAPASIPNAS